MKTSELLRKAADEIRRRGWFQGHYGDKGPYDSCAVCSLGAIAAAEMGDPWEAADGSYRGAWMDAARALRDVISPDSAINAVVAWNDDPERSQEEVLDTFERAAKKAEEAGD